MADKPAEFARWAENDIVDVRNINGIDTNLPNKIEPTEEWKLSGERTRENLPREYVNYQFNLLDEWVQNLDERTSTVGSVHLTTASETAGSLNLRFGGTWVANGSATLGTLSGINVWERTA